MVPRPRRRRGRRRAGRRPRGPAREAARGRDAASGADDAERAAELVRETWRELEEFNLNPPLALEALFVRLRRSFAGSLPRPA